MQTTATKRDKAVILALIGNLDAVSSTPVLTQIDALIADGERRIIFDLSGLEFVSSAGLRVFLTAAKNLKAQQGKLFLSGARANILDILKISGFSTFFPNYADLEEAVTAANA